MPVNFAISVDISSCDLEDAESRVVPDASIGVCLCL